MKILNDQPKESFQRDIEQQLASFVQHCCDQYQNADASIDYDAMQLDQVLDQINDIINHLQDFNPIDLEGLLPRQIAFWLNCYNLLALQLVLKLNVKKTIRKARGYFSDYGYQIGDFQFSLDDIEHGILRLNGRRYGRLGHLWGKSDPRTKLMCEEFDPRIHFCMFNACRSSPRLRAFSADSLNSQLDQATNDYMSRFIIIDAFEKEALVPKVFHWYQDDFGSFEQLSHLIANHLDRARQRMWSTLQMKEEHVFFVDYHWELNKQAQ